MQAGRMHSGTAEDTNTAACVLGLSVCTRLDTIPVYHSALFEYTFSCSLVGLGVKLYYLDIPVSLILSNLNPTVLSASETNSI